MTVRKQLSLGRRRTVQVEVRQRRGRADTHLGGGEARRPPMPEEPTAVTRGGTDPLSPAPAGAAAVAE